MSQVLYRTFRPRKFADVVNQEAVKTTLKNAVSANSVAHAYLFTGPRGVGKTSMARILARAVNCEKSISGEPCDKCKNCKAVSEGNFFDLIEVDAASNTGVDNIREIIEHVKFSPASGKHKVIVVDEVHMLSKGAFNALLKTLEEPPAHAIFVLATTEIHKVPATIISRTQRFDFKRLGQADIAGQLVKVVKATKVKFPEAGLTLIARASTGSMRDALSLLDQALSFSKAEITVAELEQMLGLTSLASFQDFFDSLAARDTAKALKFLKSMAGAGKDIQQFALGFLEYLERILYLSVTMDREGSADVTAEDFAREQNQAEVMHGSDLARLLNLFLDAAQKVKYASIPQLPLEMAAFEFCENKSQTNQITAKSFGKAYKEQEQSKPVTAQKQENPAKIHSSAVADFNKHWQDILVKVREYNHSLISSLRLARVVNFSDQELTLAFPYRFHKDAVEQRKNRVVIEKVLEEVLGGQYKLHCLMEHEAADAPTHEENVNYGKSNLVEEAVKVFGTSSSSS